MYDTDFLLSFFVSSELVISAMPEDQKASMLVQFISSVLAALEDRTKDLEDLRIENAELKSDQDILIDTFAQNLEDGIVTGAILKGDQEKAANKLLYKYGLGYPTALKVIVKWAELHRKGKVIGPLAA